MTLNERIVAHIKAHGIKYSTYTPVEEIDPVRADDGTLWKNWRHTGEVVVYVNGKRYEACCEHNLAAAWDVVLPQIAADLGMQ
jgi:hypothetical protein